MQWGLRFQKELVAAISDVAMEKSVSQKQEKEEKSRTRKELKLNMG